MMDKQSESFFNAASSEGYVYNKKNETDYQRFHKFQEEINARYSPLEKERAKKERIQSLRNWDHSLPERWQGARLNKIENPAAQEASNIIKEHGKGSFYLTGSPGSGKTYIGYAITRKYIGAGWTSLPQVMIISEESILNMAYTGFVGKNKYEKLFDPKYNMYIFDNVGERDSYDITKEIPLWERIIDHIYNKSLSAIFTSNNSPMYFSTSMSDSTQAKLSTLIHGRVLTVKGSRAPSLDYYDQVNKKTSNDAFDQFSD